MYAYIILKTGIEESEELVQELKGAVRKDLGAFAAPDFILACWVIIDTIEKRIGGKELTYRLKEGEIERDRRGWEER